MKKRHCNSHVGNYYGYQPAPSVFYVVSDSTPKSAPTNSEDISAKQVVGTTKYYSDAIAILAIVLMVALIVLVFKKII